MDVRRLYWSGVSGCVLLANVVVVVSMVADGDGWFDVVSVLAVTNAVYVAIVLWLSRGNLPWEEGDRDGE